MIRTDRALEIERIAADLKRRYDTSDPYELADCLKIMVDFDAHPGLLGFCFQLPGKTVIGLNSRADYYTRRCACAHELGHIVLGHLEDPEYLMGHASTLSNMTSRFEAEANCLSAAFLTEDEDALEAIETYLNSAMAAASLCVCPEIYRAKILSLNARGYNFAVPEITGHKPWRDYVKD